MRRIQLVEKCSDHYGMPNLYTQSRAIRQLILQHYTSACKEWADVVKIYDSDSETPITNTVHTPQATEDLARWLQKMEIKDGYGSNHGDDAHTHGDGCSGGVRRLGDGTYMHRCANCGNASSALRKCSGCDDAR